MQKNKKKLFARISSIVVACASALLLCVSPFMPKVQPKNLIASADDVSDSYSYASSNLYVPFDVLEFAAPNYTYNWVAYSDALVRFDVKKDSFSLYFKTFTYTNSGAINSEDITVSDISVSDTSRHTLDIPVFRRFDTDTYIVMLYQLSSVDFNANIYKIEFGNVDGDGRILTNFVRFYDVNDNTITFSFYIFDDTDFAQAGQRVLNNRYYYIENAFRQNQEYKIGYDSGYNLGYAEGENAGNSSGQKIGYNQGYNVGYSDGVNATNTYSFFNLISAVIDAPVQAFMGLFNFELLGVNLADFFLSLLTLCFVVTVVRLLL